jgi:hypothetical protein
LCLFYVSITYKNMLFAVLSKTLFKNANSTRAYLYLFLTGMVGYILLSYQLNQYRRTGICKTINNYFYYIISIDYVIGAYFIRCVLNRKKRELDDVKKENQYTKEQQLQIAKNLELARKLNQRYEEVKKNPFIKRYEEVKKNPFIKRNDMTSQPVQPVNRQSPQQLIQKPEPQHVVQQNNNLQQNNDIVEQPKQQPQKQLEQQNNVQQQVENNKTPELADTEIPVFSGK